ncbi:hypothetical protein [Enteractinococcus helveticum]|uniref:Uncharacterized protein n=1 Tax=Enteractinococcus helveticum TaxID=1837282 RepID=A0A1B7LWQ8_9MICC|nr:hypothetical protein [Enteractinococcus helveticum]OAV59470.1 hypothetical protein A6F49_16655 [Enteractinococcus helveticum]
MFRKIPTTLAAGALALSGLVALSAPAQANTPAVQCPSALFIWDAHDQAKKRGQMVDEYWRGNTAVVVYRIDNRHEVYETNGWNTSRKCYNQKPERPKDAPKPETPKQGGGGGGRVDAPGFGGFGHNLYPSPSQNKGKVTVGPVESVS